MDQRPPEFFVTSDAYTPHVFRDQYPSIDPTTTALSQSGKVVIITGASAGIGAQGFAPAFAKAKPKGIIIVGRNAEKLNVTKTVTQKLAPHTKVVAITADLTKVESVEKLFAEIKSTFNTADVLINNAGIFSPSETIGNVSPDDWWKDFDVNVKGTFLVTQAFLKLLGSERKGTIVNMSSGIANMVGPGMSAYSMSKMTVVRLSEYVSVEYPNVAAISLQPGIVKTDMVTDGFRRFAHDTPELVGGIGVWLATDAARFLTGRFVSANWSVDDLMAMKEKIMAGNDLKFVYRGTFGLEQFR